MKYIANMAANFFTNMTCIICTGVENSVTAVQRKKKLGLLAASHHGHKNNAEIFIREGADVDGTDDMFNVFSRRVASETGIPFDTGMQEDWTPLMYAAGNGRGSCTPVFEFEFRN